ncbi:hypothetical protein G5C51_11930 [Streptomyces sp. A7024]|uniref:Uncharacterized protein n=1 Tax=Streptomyces coryli TaxID=1128680 RepID=A0A6G4TZQ5_9ACTN|nr:hypothetical protein [Streptomyces coryli]NGN64608.1 hypothetical protein [Streptomyces coryli]
MTVRPPETAAGLLPRQECEAFSQRMEHALTTFVDDPGGSVAEADAVLDETIEHLTQQLAERRKSILRPRTTERGDGDDRHATDTEELRTALLQYRDLVEQLVRL